MTIKKKVASAASAIALIGGWHSTAWCPSDNDWKESVVRHGQEIWSSYHTRTSAMCSYALARRRLIDTKIINHCSGRSLWVPKRSKPKQSRYVRTSTRILYISIPPRPAGKFSRNEGRCNNKEPVSLVNHFGEAVPSRKAHC